LNLDNKFTYLPDNFNAEKEILLSLGINSWIQIKDLKDNQIFKIVKTTLATERNLKRLRCIAMFICEIRISQEEAAILMHSGIASIKALSSLTPQELSNKTGRLERLLNTGRKPAIDLKKASLLIKKAKGRQINN